MRGLAKLTTIEAKVLFLRDPVWLLVALAVPIGILLVFGLPGFAREPVPELGGQRPIDTVLPSITLAINVGVLAISALPVYLATYREKGILRRLSTTPASPAMLLVAQGVAAQGADAGPAQPHRRPHPARRLPRVGPGRLGREHPGAAAPGRAGGGGGRRRRGRG